MASRSALTSVTVPLLRRAGASSHPFRATTSIARSSKLRHIQQPIATSFLSCRRFAHNIPKPPSSSSSASTSSPESAAPSTSSETTAAAATSSPSSPDADAQTSQPDKPPKSRVESEPHYRLSFTCAPCNTKSTHNISKQGYHKGSVLVTCPGCRNRHIISDHLNMFGDRKVTVEDLLREKGQLVKKGTLGEDGDIEFWPDEEAAATQGTAPLGGGGFKFRLAGQDEKTQ